MTGPAPADQPVAGYRIGTELDGHAPPGDPLTAWQRRQDQYRLVNPANRRKMTVIVVGTGLAGAGAAASLGQLGYRVECFSFHDSPRRAHSVAAQGGINAARARKVDGDSLIRFVTDTVKGGDYRGREADAVRLGTESVRVIDHMYAIGAPFAREYGGQLATRSFGGVQVSRTYYTRGQTGQQLEVACAQALQEQVDAGTVRMHTRTEMLDLVVADGRAQGIVTRDLLTGQISTWTGHAVILCSGGYGSVYHWSTLAMNSNATATWRAHRRGAYFASPCFVQFHPTALPVSSTWQSKTTLMSESLRNDGRIWVPARPGDDRPPNDIPEAERDYYLERRYPAFGNLTPRDVASRNARSQIDSGHGVGPLHNSVYLDFRDAIARLGRATIAERYGNLFSMYLDATGEDPYRVPMRIAPGAHFTMGGLWVDYDQMTTIPGLFVGGEASNNYHGANRLGANSLLSASVDGWFTLPLSVPNYLAVLVGEPVLPVDSAEALATADQVRRRVERLLAVGGHHRPEWFHRRLGDILYAHCGVSRDEQGLMEGLEKVRALRTEFWQDVLVVGDGDRLNQELERAGRVADFIELGETMILDALDRRESAGAHFRTEYATEDGEARRDDDHWRSVSAWETTPEGDHVRHSEPLDFSLIKLQVRDYR
ncbi:fumarate reductase/succinate dehydrogenase flavoprotein subunit [Acidipropionibacterium jensenii]|uniref:fumarate reductase/succinate dehydrogenase flavoprotein subunit n=1 Tax=Acidipropionibacterium jensenii TaxID=1749 RepID=UPI0026499D24|nr:fumarate reductase/succinate dehydrogenase flavoprotein subunit [Acidipropionibacterium jensenii]MDN5977397.1 fumarate reductase/succinate dehydrogenase flavoprotein subunit [Acidipropionibacterium jensenii]MDN6426630.1 fumarate reductase/succinate dehydrogenase flavoprotein subunit [Acidipropionibacterium jensenii]MDN6441495.1 fumarate reductase/succinate dehydrogenase flavoprotein subunit [Acidipropionibacterium jensenii]MDN6480083.1 fumarate reductase/succinate dehydrogenase flavoprotein 